MLGALTQSAQRKPAGSVPDMTALLVVSTFRRAPQGCNSLPPSRLLSDTCEALYSSSVMLMRLNSYT
jgi:hypothetical protein